MPAMSVVLFCVVPFCFFFFFFFNDTATTEIYTLSLHDALPISAPCHVEPWNIVGPPHAGAIDRKSTRLNSSHLVISYAVFCLKKKKKKQHKNTDLHCGVLHFATIRLL